MSAQEPKSPGDDAAADKLLVKIGGPAAAPTVGFLRTGVLWGVVVLLAAALAFVVVSNGRTSAEESAGDDALDAVPARVESLLSYDSATVAQDLADKKDWLTGSFAEDYEQLVLEKVAPAAAKDKTSATAKVVLAGVSSADDDRVMLVMFVNVTVTSPTLSTPQETGSRLRVTAERVDGDWLISELEPI